MPDTLPPIKAYNKLEIRLLLKDPTVNLSTLKNNQGQIVVPISNRSLKENLIKYLKELDIESEELYNSTRLFFPQQVAFIFNKFL